MGDRAARRASRAVNDRSPIEQISGWFTWIRFAAVPIAAVYIASEADSLSDGYETTAWVGWALLTAQAIAILVLRRGQADESRRRNVDAAAIVLDIAVVTLFVIAFSGEAGQA